MPDQPVLEFRLVLTTSDYNRLVNFYCTGLGIEPAEFFSNDGGRAVLLEMGRATLEIFDETQAEAIDRLETGQRLSGQVRIALQVPDLQAGDGAPDRERSARRSSTRRSLTPWGDTNARFQDPDGMQITLFQAGR